MKTNELSKPIAITLERLSSGGRLSIIYECGEHTGRTDHFLPNDLVKQLARTSADFTKAETS